MDRSMALRLYAVVLVALASAGCELAEGIFKAGMWVGILMVVAIVGIVLFAAAKLRG